MLLLLLLYYYDDVCPPGPLSGRHINNLRSVTCFSADLENLQTATYLYCNILCVLLSFSRTHNSAILLQSDYIAGLLQRAPEAKCAAASNLNCTGALYGNNYSNNETRVRVVI